MANKESERKPQKKVQMVFLDGNYRTHRWTPKYVREDVTQEQLNELANEIAKIGVFQKDGVPYCIGVARMKPVRETIETKLFETIDEYLKETEV